MSSDSLVPKARTPKALTPPSQSRRLADVPALRPTTPPVLVPARSTAAMLIRTAGIEQTSLSRSAMRTRETPTVRAVRRGTACVVNIHSEKRSKPRDSVFTGTGDRKVNGMGTGIVVDERGYIVTNYHVVENVDSLRVTFEDGAAYPARTVSYDRTTDLALIHVTAPAMLQTMPLGTSSDLMLGEDVLAIGNAFGYEHSVTRGIISALGRDVEVNEFQSYRNLVQIDAAINPGNSGGPLLNTNGEVIGINVAIRAGAQRIGFAIPIDDARLQIARLLSVERMDLYHGLVTRDRKSSLRSELVVAAVDPASPAAQCGLIAGDVITKVGSLRTIDGVDLERSLVGRTAGEPVEVEFVRDGIAMSSRMMLSASGRRPRRTVQKQPTPAVPVSTDLTWSTLGLAVRPITAGQLRQIDTSYRGGLVVTQVRPGSPAAANAIEPGDVLVGLHLWETVRRDNIEFVLRHPERQDFSPLKFYIWRGGETLFGYFDVTAR